MLPTPQEVLVKVRLAKQRRPRPDASGLGTPVIPLGGSTIPPSPGITPEPREEVKP